MKITDEIIDYAANLSKIKIDESEREGYKADMEKIITYMEKLNELDTENVDELSHILPSENVFREDEVCSSLSVEDVLKNAPDKALNCFKVPKTVE